MTGKINIKNRKASFEYEFIVKFVAGISLVGTEIKSTRNNKANISDAYCVFNGDELFVKILSNTFAGCCGIAMFLESHQTCKIYPSKRAFFDGLIYSQAFMDYHH